MADCSSVLASVAAIPNKVEEIEPAGRGQILVAEDDLPLANFLRRSLQGESYLVDLVHDGETIGPSLRRAKYQLLVLDINLPKKDGLTVLRELRGDRFALPVLVLTARSRLEDRVLCLDSGADDCLNKPFSLSELSARVRALLRRNSDKCGSVLTVGDLVLDRDEWRVERAGRRIELTARELGLLEYLMRNAGRAVTRAMIMENVWNLPFDPSSNLVDVYVKYVRDKVDGGVGAKLIRTIRNVGYVISSE